MSDFMLYTEWVDDNGDFKTGQNLLKPLDVNFMYAKDDGLMTIAGKAITDIEVLKPGQIIQRKWPYLQNVYYRAQVVQQIICVKF